MSWRKFSWQIGPADLANPISLPAKVFFGSRDVLTAGKNWQFNKVGCFADIKFSVFLLQQASLVWKSDKSHPIKVRACFSVLGQFLKMFWSQKGASGPLTTLFTHFFVFSVSLWSLWTIFHEKQRSPSLTNNFLFVTSRQALVRFTRCCFLNLI